MTEAIEIIGAITAMLVVLLTIGTVIAFVWVFLIEWMMGEWL